MNIMAKKIATLYVDDASLRLLVVQGKRIKKWADSPLEPGLVKSNVVMDEAAVAAKVRQLFKTQKVGTKQVIVGLSGLHCLTRPVTLPPLPRALLDEAVMREAKRVLPVPLDQLYLSWQVLSAADGKLQVFIVAIPCKTADPLIRMLHQAGLKPYLMDLKPLALARVVKEATAIVIDVQSTEFDIVIMVDGVLQPIRTVSLPTEALFQEEKWLKVKEELDRTIKFYNSNNPDKPLGTDVPILVSGELANRPGLNKSLSDELGFPVITLTSPRCPEELDAARLMVNVGLALKQPSFRKESVPLVMNVNALPAPYRPKPLPVLKLVALPSGLAFISLAVMLTLFVQDASASVDSMRGQLEAADKLITQRQLKQRELKKTITDLEKKVAGVEASRNTLTAALSAIGGQHERINGDLQLITDKLPGTITVAGVSQTAEKLTIQGRAPDEVEVLSYARSLEPSGRFSEITVTNIVRLQSEGMDFVLTLKTKRKS